MKDKKEEITIDVKVNDEEIQEAINKAEELNDVLKGTTIRNIENVYITINNFAKEK